MIQNEEARCALETRIHPESEVKEAIDTGDHDSIVIRETIGQLALEGRWSEIWAIADSMGREVSILLDRRNRAFVDIGTAGRVNLSPPDGSEVPFRLWVHTHPRDAYWSSTDRGSLALYSGLLDEALVLGFDHLKRSVNGSGHTNPLELEGPLSRWSSEEVVTYEKWGDGHVE